MLFLFVSPGFFLLLTTFFAASATLLRYTGRITLVRLILVDIAISLVIAIVFAGLDYEAFGAQEAASTFIGYGCLAVLLPLGSSAWWLLRPASTKGL